MFKQALKLLPLTDANADEVFPNIKADHFEGDESFCATLRMLLYSRIESEGSINVKLCVFTENGAINERQAIWIENNIVRVNNPLPKDTVYVVVMKGYSDDNFIRIGNSAKSKLPTYQHHPQVSLYLSQIGNKTDVYIDESDRRTICFCTKPRLHGVA